MAPGIHVRTWDMPDGGVGIELSGHALMPEDGAEDVKEHNQVCAGASMLLVTLAAMTNGTWNGNNSGSVVCLVPSDMLQHLEFAIVGLILIDRAYVGHVHIERKDTRLPKAWKQVDQWTDQHDDSKT